MIYNKFLINSLRMNQRKLNGHIMKFPKLQEKH